MIDPSTLDWQKGNGLIPAIIQDARTGRVLMLGYMNAESLKCTIDSGNVTFYSRSKKRLWEKGETSGNTLKLNSIYTDCDNDTLLIRATPKGPTCHKGDVSCFDASEIPLETIGELIETIKQRNNADVGSSYTKRLLDGGLEAYGAKVLEEAEEVVKAAGKEGKQRTIEEASDLLYHLLVLLKGQGIELDDIAMELIKRRN